MGKRFAIVRNENYNDVFAQDAFDEFITEKEAINLAKKTIINYKDCWKRFTNDLGVDLSVNIEEINQQVIYSWIAILKNELSISSVNCYVALIRTFLYWCMDEERQYIKNPFTIHLLKNQETPPKHYTEEEIEKLLVKPKIKDTYFDWRSWAIINFILGTGARASTVSNMTIGNINFVGKDINLGYTKNNQALIVPLSPALELVLREYIKLWRNNARNEELLFPSISNDVLIASKIWQSVGSFVKKRKVRYRGVHSLRHNFAIGWVRNNGNMFALQKILGHSTLDMTKKYVKLFAEDIKVNFELYNPLDTAKRNKSRKQQIKRAN